MSFRILKIKGLGFLKIYGSDPKQCYLRGTLVFFKVTILQETTETVCEAGASGRGSVLDIKAVHCTVKLTGRKVSLLIRPDTTFIRMGSVFSIRAGHYI